MRTPVFLLVIVLALLAAAYALAVRGVDLGLPSTPLAGSLDPRLDDPVAAESLFRAALEAAPDSATSDRLRYNLGTSLLLQTRYDDARPHLEAAGRTPDPGVAAAYNLGNTDLEPAFRDSLLEARQDRLHRALEAYKHALLAAPADLDAKWNLELTLRLLADEESPSGGGGGSGGGGDGPPLPGTNRPAPAPATGPGPQPSMTPTEAEDLLRSAAEREQQVQRDRLRKPQPPGPILP